MRVIIAGSRGLSPDAVRRALDACPWTTEIATVLSGTARGVDEAGEAWASEHGLPIERFPPDWKTQGKRAGPIRNEQMARVADGLIAVWDGQSPGTRHMIDVARARGLRVFVFDASMSRARPTGLTPQGRRDSHRAIANGPHSRAASYRLNTLPVYLPRTATIKVNRIPLTNDTDLDDLRRQLGPGFLVRRRGREVETIPLTMEAPTQGETSILELNSRLDLGQYLVREWLSRSLIRHSPRRGPGGVIQYISERRESNLLLECLPRDVTIPDGIGRRIAADFDIRRIHQPSGEPQLVICIDVRSRVTLDCTVATLMSLGVDVRGAYVLRETQTQWGARRRLAGRVHSVSHERLLLEDHDDGITELSPAEAWLEPRKENLELVIGAVVGRRLQQVMSRLNDRIAERLGGRARPALIDDWANAIRRFPPDIAQDIQLRLDDQILAVDSGKFLPYELYSKPRLVFDVGSTKTETWNQGGLDKHGPYNFERFAPKRLNIAVICQAAKQGDVERFVQQLLEGVPGSKYAENGFIRRYHLQRPFLRTFATRSPSAAHYREAVAAAIDDGTTRGEPWNLALVQIDEVFHDLHGDSNPYLLTKALLLQQQIPSQAFEFETIRANGNLDATINNIGLAAYAKVNGIPWLLPVHQAMARELIIGLGSYETSNSRFGNRQRYIGVATAFTAEGSYMLESRTPATPADNYLPMLLAALERVVSEVRAQQGWSNTDPVRLIFHVFKDFNYSEIDAVRELMRRLALPHAEFAFVHLVEDHPYMLFDPTEAGSGGVRRKGIAAAPRGLRVDLGARESLLCLKGPREIKQWTDGIPRPMLLRLHRASTFRDLTYLSRQVFDFTCLSWRTLLPSPLPITVLYAGLVARMLVQLRDVSCWAPEAILGPVGRGRWFL